MRVRAEGKEGFNFYAVARDILRDVRQKGGGGEDDGISRP
jgi:hypothetical protein